MRLRVFSISLIVGLISAALVTFLQVSYVRSERLNMIDEQLRESAETLIDSDFTALRRSELSEADEIISDELGPRRIGKIFVLRNAQGEILFQSQSLEALELNLPQEPQWLTLKKEGRFIRILNLKLPKISDRKLQLGMVMDDNFLSLNWKQVSWRTPLYILAILAVMVSASFLLSSLVMRPFLRLQRHLEKISTELVQFQTLPGIPESDFKFAVRRNKDEFGQLLKMLNSLIVRINWVSSMTKLWSSRLAHELKTPMTILRLETDELVENAAVKKTLMEQIDRMSKMIFDFLNWAETGSEPASTALSELSMAQLSHELEERLKKVSAGRLKIEILSDWKVRALAEHAETLLKNLVDNALKYSPPGKTVRLRVDAGSIEVIDEGPGLPAKVKQSLGTPFNRGSEKNVESPSSGLGLALVEAICRRYNWALESKTEDGKHICRVFNRPSANL